MRRRLAAGVAAPLLLALSMISTPAPGQPISTEKARTEARALADRGYSELERGDLAAAQATFEQAEALFHAPTLVLMIARTEEKRGRLADAQRSYERLLAESLGEDAPKEFHAAHADGAKELSALKPRVPKLVVNGPVGAAAPALWLDGRALAASEVGRPLPVNPGDHTVALGDGERREVRRVRLEEGQQKEVTLAASSATPAAPIAGAREGSLAPGIVSFAVGGAGLVLGAVTGALALSTFSELEERCPSRQCDPADEGLADDTNLYAALSTTGFVVAGVGAAVGVVLVITRPGGSGGATSSIAIEVGPSMVGLRGSF